MLLITAALGASCAYELSNQPQLLFNIAQALRAKRDHAAALVFYRNYLRLVPNAPNRADAESLALEMQQRAAEDDKRAAEARRVEDERRAEQARTATWAVRRKGPLSMLSRYRGGCVVRLAEVRRVHRDVRRSGRRRVLRRERDACAQLSDGPGRSRGLGP